jgi:DNA polymerase-3 subunit epsilon
MIKLTRPLTNIDSETTGTKISTARIVSLSLIKINPDGTTENKLMMLNPGIPIPAEATSIHGITDEMVADKPLFGQCAKEIYGFILDCDFQGYNIAKFDIALLIEEFLRCGIDFDLKDIRVLDSCSIFQKKEKRDLSAALMFFTGEELIGAHGAEADNIASIKVFMAQTEYYPDIAEMTIDEIAKFCNQDEKEKIDLAGVFYKDEEGDACYSWGKHQGKKVKEELGYLSWILRDESYTLQTKKCAQRMMNFYSKKK